MRCGGHVFEMKEASFSGCGAGYQANVNRQCVAEIMDCSGGEFEDLSFTPSPPQSGMTFNP